MTSLCPGVGCLVCSPPLCTAALGLCEPPALPPPLPGLQLLEVVADSGSDPTYAAMGRSAGQYTVRLKAPRPPPTPPPPAPPPARCPAPMSVSVRPIGLQQGTRSLPLLGWAPAAPGARGATHRPAYAPPMAPGLQIIPIDSTPGWLMALTGVFCAIGPIALAGFFVVEKVIKKRD